MQMPNFKQRPTFCPSNAAPCIRCRPSYPLASRPTVSLPLHGGLNALSAFQLLTLRSLQFVVSRTVSTLVLSRAASSVSGILCSSCIYNHTTINGVRDKCMDTVKNLSNIFVNLMFCIYFSCAILSERRF